MAQALDNPCQGHTTTAAAEGLAAPAQGSVQPRHGMYNTIGGGYQLRQRGSQTVCSVVGHVPPHAMPMAHRLCTRCQECRSTHLSVCAGAHLALLHLLLPRLLWCCLPRLLLPLPPLLLC